MGLVRWIRGGRDRVALLVDGPNVFRGEFDIELDDLRDAVTSEGQLAIAELFLDEHASPGLIRAAEAHGFAVTVTSGDVDVTLATTAMDFVHRDGIDILAIASRDIDFKPVLERASYYGVETIAIAPGEHGRSDGLTKAADTALLLGE